MKKNRQKAVPLSFRQSGFTLIELLIGMAIGAILLTAVTMTYQRFVASITAQNVAADLQLNGRAALEFMIREIRMAGFTRSILDKDSFGIEEAQSGKLRFTWDQIDSGSSGDDGEGDVETDKEEIISYYLDTTDHSIKRQLNESTVNMSKQTLIGGGEQIIVSDFNLTYLDEDGDTLTSTSSSALISRIRSIVITLQLEAPAGKAGTISRTYVGSVRCRNLGF